MNRLSYEFWIGLGLTVILTLVIVRSIRIAVDDID